MLSMALVLAVAIAALPMAAAEVDPQLLYDLARQAQIQAEIQMESGDAVAKDLLLSGTVRTDAIMEAATIQEAGEHFLAAMQLFVQAFRVIDEGSASSDDIQPDMMMELERLERYYTQLQDLAHRYGLDVSYSESETLFQNAAEQMQRDPEQSAEIMETIQSEAAALLERINIVAAEEDKTRAMRYAELYGEQLDRLIIRAEKINMSDKTVAKMQEIQAELAAAAEPVHIISLIQDVIAIKEGLDMGQSDRLKVWMFYIEDIIDQYWDEDRLDHIQYAAVTGTLETARGLLYSGDLTEAADLLGHIDRWLLDLDE